MIFRSSVELSIWMFQKLRRQEELMKRQAELQKEMAAQKREAAERRLAEKRGGSEPRSRTPKDESPPPSGINFRSDSPPIPTIRNRSPEKRAEKEEVGGKEEEVVEQLSHMRQGLERRREELEQENGVWDGLAEI